MRATHSFIINNPQCKCVQKTAQRAPHIGPHRNQRKQWPKGGWWSTCDARGARVWLIPFRAITKHKKQQHYKFEGITTITRCVLVWGSRDPKSKEREKEMWSNTFIYALSYWRWSTWYFNMLSHIYISLTIRPAYASAWLCSPSLSKFGIGAKWRCSMSIIRAPGRPADHHRHHTSVPLKLAGCSVVRLAIVRFGRRLVRVDVSACVLVVSSSGAPQERQDPRNAKSLYTASNISYLPTRVVFRSTNA